MFMSRGQGQRDAGLRVEDGACFASIIIMIIIVTIIMIIIMIVYV